ncbi:MAG TPA: HlyD family secretion protein [Oculatellaceae cyanobacterium]
MQDSLSLVQGQVESTDAPDSPECITPTETITSKAPTTKKRKILISLVLVALIAVAVAAYPLVQELFSYVETDNAYITGHVHGVSPRIAGTVKEVLVNDNQIVKAGDVLAILDDRDEVISVRKAEAHLQKLSRDVSVSSKIIAYASSNASAAEKTAEASIATALSSISKEEHVVREAVAGIAIAKNQLTQREAELRKAQLDLHRYTALEKAGAVATENLDTAERDYDVAVAARKAAVDAVEQANSKLAQAQSELNVAKAKCVEAKAAALQAKAANAQVDVDSGQKTSSEGSVQEAQVDLDNARLTLSYTRIVAPIDGRVGRKTIEVGQRLQPGSQVLALVSNDKWIVANYKETQLRDIHVGQPVKITIDSLGDHVFTGRVESFSPASGASFALLPPDNATGNFTKIVQRIPVKIVLNQATMRSYGDRLTPGMSCVVKVKVH